MRGLLGPGDHMVVPTDAYGGTYRLVAKVQQRWGVDHSLAKVSQPDAIRGEIRPGVTKMIWLETPTNPLLGIADIAAIAEIAHEAGALLVVDNTFASPYLQQPIALGADIVVHSTTKYVGGHSDVVGGAVVVAPQIAVPEYADAAERIAFHQNSMGGVAGPMDSWLTLRGLKTLAVRMERHCDNAERVVEFLRGRSDVTHVNYPGLDFHPGHDVAAKQMRRFGGMVSFQVEGGEQRALDIVGSTKLWILGESLGGVESLIEHPGRMTHASVAGTELEVPSDLIRLSVGIEDVDDLVADLEQAMG
ncbi:cystathionine gamma-synthase [Barrientosiimonas endolithica]|uniref:Cystathionine gamma-synthase n=1 Tax=Barrientosiimonas endolithica TaxID=1535208 RepID=A0ABM8HDZ5_9MICO|nr:cystathionine gamma-synthase [Barrientosiimonas endolithica]